MCIIKKYGGIWFDCDTVITSDKISVLLNLDSECVMIARHIGFIIAQKDAKILNIWEKGVKRNIALHKFFNKKSFVSKIVKNLFPRMRKQLNNWDIMGNYIINPVIENSKSNEFVSIDRVKLNALPEIIWAKYKDNTENYRQFYFYNNIERVIQKTNGIICLHNSWTPEEFKKMSKEEFLSQDNTLANILKELLFD